MTIDRREWLKGLAGTGAGAAFGAGAVFALDDYLPPQEPSRAAELKLAGAKEFTTACNFCSCGCGMVGHVVEDKLARKIQSVRDANWVATEKDGEQEYAVNRTDAIAFLGGAQSTNEECYLWTKTARLYGTSFLEHQARL